MVRIKRREVRQHSRKAHLRRLLLPRRRLAPGLRLRLRLAPRCLLHARKKVSAKVCHYERVRVLRRAVDRVWRERERGEISILFEEREKGEISIVFGERERGH